MKIASAKEMQQLDRAAMEEYHIPGIVLMEKAGQGTVEHLVNTFGPVRNRRVLVVVGPGNNGGDGLVIARIVHQMGGKPHILYLADPDSMKGDAAINRDICSELSLPVTLMDAAVPSDLHSPWVIVDALFGTGLQRELSGPFLAVVEWINEQRAKGCPVVSVDIPSGMHTDTGQALGGAVAADLTVTYGLPKPAHYHHGGGRCGTIRIVDIGIPAEVVARAGLDGEVIQESILDHRVVRSAKSHKGTYGHLLVLAGSAGKSGAALLCGLGSLRVGTGLVTMAIPADLRTVFESCLHEAMTLMLPDSRRYPSHKDLPVLQEHMEGKNALVIGPGIGTATKTRDLVLKLYREATVPMVVDADALNILALTPDALADPPAPRILTPHPGEMARLADTTTSRIQEDRTGTALRFTRSANRHLSHVTLILKGAGTIVSDPGGTWAINSSGNPGMAAGGMGDVLSGIIGGLLAQGMTPGTASRYGVHIHGLAADFLARKRTLGYLASEVADAVPRVITRYSKQQTNKQQGV